MDTFLVIVGIICLILGLLGCIIPMLPGPPVSWLAMLLLKFCGRYADSISGQWLCIWAGIVVATLVLDYIIPIWGTKTMGGTKYGIWGATVGVIVGLFFLPLGIILGPFFGALLGESLNNSDDRTPLKAAVGALLGFLLSTGVKLIVCGLITARFIRILIN
ncbi:MAG: DUF456 domain-containing protein [Bacteroidales bacterium]|jgi:uncharacterized protein YqgC (DUF456 family)|nr:DUF456 domain-containing protein [Bacteroidales bacterium]